MGESRVDDRNHEAASTRAQARSYWRKQLARAPAGPSLPTDPLAPAESPSERHINPLAFEATESLRTLSLTLALPPLAVGAACLAWIIGQHAHVDEVLVMVEDGGSADAVLRLPIDWAGCTLAGLATNAAAQLAAAARPEHALELADIFATGPESWAGVRHPVAVAVSLQPRPARRPPPIEPALLLSLPVRGGATLHSLSGTVSSEIASRLAQRIGVCAGAAPVQPLLEIPMMAADEAAFVALACNRTVADWGEHVTVHDAFRTTAAVHSAATALRAARGHDAGGALAELGMPRQISYAELDHRSDLLSGRLLRLARKTMEAHRRLVGLIFERSDAMVVAIFGALKAGGGYLPIEPSYPQVRAPWKWSWRMHVHGHVHTYMHTRRHMRTCAHAHMRTCAHAHMRTRARTCDMAMQNVR